MKLHGGLLVKGMDMTVAIIGAGMAGAAAASTLQNAGVKVEVFDKGRSVGGRMSSKRATAGYLDLGAQYFTARSRAFQQQVEHWLAAGMVTRWQARFFRYQHAQLSASADDQTRFVGAPSMQTPVKALLADVKTHLNCRISRLHFVATPAVNGAASSASGWYLYDEKNQCFGPYQALLLTLPPVQLQTLLATASGHTDNLQTDLNDLLRQLQSQALLPCWAVNLQLAQPLQTAADAVFVKEGNISWLARQNSKPGRAGEYESWLVHFSPQCSALYLDAAPAQLATLAKAELELIFDQPLRVNDALCHRWLYAQVNPTVRQQPLAGSAGLNLAIAGDWVFGGRVENAWLSGVAAAKEVMVYVS
tara:strand:- start:10319 stop:11404 length:1086 start_codon:yes stop_codon:yes gene_type:complete